VYRLLPIFFLLAISPESDKKLEHLNSFITATKETVQNIRNGIETFHAAMMPFIANQEAKTNSPPPPAPEQEEPTSQD